MYKTAIFLVFCIPLFAVVTQVTAQAEEPEAQLVWAKSAGGTSEDHLGSPSQSGSGWGCPQTVAALAGGGAVVSGTFRDIATFGHGGLNETVLVAAGECDIFVAKYNTDSSLAWAKRAGSPEEDYSFAVAALSDGSSVVTGSFRGRALFGQGEANETAFDEDYPSSLLIRMFVAKYNPDGTLAWAKASHAATDDPRNVRQQCTGQALAALAEGGILVTGWCDGAATFGKGEANETTLAISPSRPFVFAARYNSDGTLAWARQAGGYGGSCGKIAAALSDGGAIVCGSYSPPVVFGEGEPNETTLPSIPTNAIFLAKYNAEGSLAWVKSLDLFAGDTQRGAYFHVGTLPDGAFMLTGGFMGAVTFGAAEANETVLSAEGGYDLFLAKYNSDGSLAWAKRAGGSKDERGTGIAALSGDSILVTGTFEGSITFGPGEANETTLSAAGENSIFLAIYSGNGALAGA